MDSVLDGRPIAGERREAERISVMLTGAIDRAGSSTPVRLSNLSDHGSTMVGRELPPTGAWVTLRRKHIALRGRVAWTSDGRGGLHFEDRLEPRDALIAVAPSRARPRSQCRRPRLHGEPLSRAELESILRCANLLGVRAAFEP